MSMIERVARAIDAAPTCRRRMRKIKDGAIYEVYIAPPLTEPIPVNGPEIIGAFQNIVDAACFADAWNMKSQARAAIEAMREPTEAMVEAGVAVDEWCQFGGQAPQPEVYRKMIDEALK